MIYLKILNFCFDVTLDSLKQVCVWGGGVCGWEGDAGLVAI